MSFEYLILKTFFVIKSFNLDLFSNLYIVDGYTFIGMFAANLSSFFFNGTI